MSMQAKVTVEADVNILALSRMLAENGRWLIYVHERRIVKATKIPPEVPIDELLGEDLPPLPESDSETG